MAEKEKPYGFDEVVAVLVDVGQWRAIEAGVLEDPWNAPPAEPYALTLAPASAPAPVEIVVGFECGLPVSLDGEELQLATLIAAMNRRAGLDGIGRIDMIENRAVGIKSREVYEAPGAIALIAAHSALEEVVLTKDEARLKRPLEQRWTELVYEGRWFSPAREAIDAFVDSTQELVSGDVRLELLKGRVGEDLDLQVWGFLRADDAELLPYDCEATAEHAQRLADAGLLTSDELDEVESRLAEIAQDPTGTSTRMKTCTRRSSGSSATPVARSTRAARSTTRSRRRFASTCSTRVRRPAMRSTRSRSSSCPSQSPSRRGHAGLHAPPARAADHARSSSPRLGGDARSRPDALRGGR